jgi:hypothetical protein
VHNPNVLHWHARSLTHRVAFTADLLLESDVVVAPPFGWLLCYCAAWSARLGSMPDGLVGATARSDERVGAR